MFNRYKQLFTLLIFFPFILFSCLKSKKPGIPESTLKVLDQAGVYKPTLMKTILEFDSEEDSLKLKATYFLIENLKHNYTIEYSLQDSSGNEIDIDFRQFGDLRSIIDYKDSLEKLVGKLHYEPNVIELDFNNLGSDFLIQNIKNSFKYFNNIGIENYDFKTFCEYILPYRVANEEPEIYHGYFWKEYGNIDTTKKSIRDIAILINKEVNKRISCDSRMEVIGNYQTINSIDSSKHGNLLDINIYKIKALRSFGIAAALDYTPYFVDSISGYYSTTVLLPNGSKLYLKNSDNLSNPYGNKRVAKIYRRIFTSDESGLFAIKGKDLHTPPFLGNYNYADVTNEYIETTNKEIYLSLLDSNYLYLAIKSDNKLKAIDWAKVTDGRAIFKDLAPGLYYTPVIVKNKSLIKVGERFLLE